EPVDVCKVGVEALGRRKSLEGLLAERESTVEKTAGTRGVDDEPRTDPEPAAVADAVERGAAVLEADVFDRRPVEVLDSLALGLPHEKLVEVRPVPMRIGDFVARARGDEELIRAVLARGESLAEPVAIERESSLEAAADLGMGALPASPGCQRSEAGQGVALAQRFQQEVRERGGGLTDREPRVGAALQQEDRFPQTREAQRGQRTAEARAHDRDVD